MTQIRVSDHALVRFLQRAGGFDVDAVRSAIEQSLERAALAAISIGEDDYTIRADGLTYIVRGHVVVTILPAGVVAHSVGG